MFHVYTITAFPTGAENVNTPSTWASVQAVWLVPLGPNGSWGVDQSNWGDPSLNWVNDDPTQAVLSGYWGLQNKLDGSGNEIPAYVQLSAAALTSLQGIANVTVTEETR